MDSDSSSEGASLLPVSASSSSSASTSPLPRRRRRGRCFWIGALLAGLLALIATLALSTVLSPALADASVLIELVCLYTAPYIGPTSQDCRDGARWCPPRYPRPLPPSRRVASSSSPPPPLDLATLLASRSTWSAAPTTPRLIIGTQTFNYGDMAVEWVLFHLMQGVAHIYIYDDVGDDRMATRLEIFIKSGVVTLLSVWPDDHEMFVGQYPSHHMLSMLKQAESAKRSGDGGESDDALMHTWMIWCDMDEYFFAPPTTPRMVPTSALSAPLAEALARVPPGVDRLAVRGKIFGTGKMEIFAPAVDGLLIETHTRRPPYSVGEALGPTGLACCGHCYGAILNGAWKTWLRVGRTPLLGNEHMLHSMHTEGETMLITPYQGAQWIGFHHYMYASLRIVRRKAAISTTKSQAGYYADLIRDTRCRRTFVERVDDRALAPLWPAARLLWTQWRAAAPLWRSAAQLAALPDAALPAGTYALRSDDGWWCGVETAAEAEAAAAATGGAERRRVLCTPPPSAAGAKSCAQPHQLFALRPLGAARYELRRAAAATASSAGGACAVDFAGQLACAASSDGSGAGQAIVVRRASPTRAVLIDDGGDDGQRAPDDPLFRPLRVCIKGRYPVATLFEDGGKRRAFLKRGVGSIRCTRSLVDPVGSSFEFVPEREARC